MRNVNVVLAGCFAMSLLFAGSTNAQSPNDDAIIDPSLAREGTADALDEAYGQSRESIEVLRFEGVEDIIRMLRDSTGEIAGLRSRIETEEQVEFDEIVDTLERVSQRFWEIADSAPEIVSSRLRELGNLKGVQRQIGTNIDELQASIDRLKQRNGTLERELELAAEREEPSQRLQIEKQMNASIINSYNTAIANWELFELRHGRALEILEDQNTSVEDLLFALQANARVYGAAADAARLTREVRTVLDELDQLIHIGDVVTELVRSWDDLDIIMDELRLDFHRIPGF
ncbi:MAG: hypothetical protein AAFY56_16125 [Pseudomonadota bacterium]